MADEMTVRVFPDGDEICALVGPNLMTGTAGFGTDASSALRALAQQLDLQQRESKHLASEAA